MSKKNRLQRQPEQWLNDVTFQLYFSLMKNICLAQFRYENVPSTVNIRWIENSLFEKGFCVYFRDAIIGDLALSGTIGPRLDVYGDPIDRTAVGLNGYNARLDKSNSVLIWNNFDRTAGAIIATEYARKLALNSRIIDVNLAVQKTPIIIRTTEQQRLTMENAIKQQQENAITIFADNDIDLSGTEVWNLNAPFLIDQLNVNSHELWNQFLTFRGIENSNMDKKERLIVSETSGNNGAIEVFRRSLLEPRELAVQQINEMFGTDIKVSMNSDLPTQLNTPGAFLSQLTGNAADSVDDAETDGEPDE